MMVDESRGPWRVGDQPLPPGTDCYLLRQGKYPPTPIQAELSGEMTSDLHAGSRGFPEDIIQDGVSWFLPSWPVPRPSLFSGTQSQRGCNGSQGHPWAQPPGSEGVTTQLTPFSARIRVSQATIRNQGSPSCWPASDPACRE